MIKTFYTLPTCTPLQTTEDRTVFITFANVWNLLNLFRAIVSGYLVQLQGDVTFVYSNIEVHKCVLKYAEGYDTRVGSAADTSLQNSFVYSDIEGECICVADCCR